MSPYKRGLWTAEEDKILIDYVTSHGLGHWNLIPKRTGLKRCGKSCRLRWMNYLSPTVKKGRFSDEEEDLIIRLHKLIGNRWSLIAKRVPGRTDNQVKNYWNTHLSKKVVGIGLYKLHQPPMLVASSSTARLSQAAQSDAAAVKERQSSNEVDKTLNRLVEEEDCVKSFWDFDHQLTALNMAELLQGYPKQKPICMDYDS